MSGKPVMKCPINYFENNMYFNAAQNCWAAYKLTGFNYDYQNADTKYSIMLSLVLAIKNVTHVKIMVIPTIEDVGKHHEKLKKKIRPGDILHDEAISIIDKTCKYLEERGQEENDYTTYFIVKLQDEAVDEMELVGKQIVDFFKAPLYNLTSALLLNPDDITAVTYKKFTNTEEEVFQTLRGCVSLERTSGAETQWLLKRVMYRGLNVPVVLNKALKTTVDEVTKEVTKEYTEEWTPYKETGIERGVEYFRPHKTDVANLFSGRLRCEGNKGISVTHDDGSVSYQSYLVMTNIPEAITFPGMEWIHNLRSQSMPIEICIDIENIHYKKAEDTLNGKQTEVNTQIQNIEDAGAKIPSRLLEAETQIESLKRELGDNKLPMSKTVISLCLTGNDKEQVDKNVKDLKQYLEKSDFGAERPGADQLKLFLQHIPGTESYTSDFVKYMSPLVMAGGIFGATTRVGDNVGYYIGMANGKPVYLNLFQACFEDESPAATFFGGLGNGKSLNTNVMDYLHVLNGAYSLVICPKGERAHWKAMPLIGKHVNIVELTTDIKNKGKLDPFNMFPDDLEYASTLATNIIIDLLGIKTTEKRYYVAIKSVKETKKASRPSMLRVVEEIKKMSVSGDYQDDARQLYDVLSVEMDTGYSKLLFGDGTEESITISGRLNVVMLQGISLPEIDIAKEEYSQEQKMANILFGQLAAFSKKFALWNPVINGKVTQVSKLTLIDESWMLKSVPSGAALIEWHSRMGRSLKHAILLNGHSVLDLPNEKLQATITYKFCFHTNNPDEAIRMLGYLKLDPTPDNINVLTGTIENGGLGKGECLFSDLYGRVARLQFDPVFDDLFAFFRTTPEDYEETTGQAATMGLPEPPQDEQVEDVEDLEDIDDNEDEDNKFDLLAAVDELLESASKTA